MDPQTFWQQHCVHFIDIHPVDQHNYIVKNRSSAHNIQDIANTWPSSAFFIHSGVIDSPPHQPHWNVKSWMPATATPLASHPIPFDQLHDYSVTRMMEGVGISLYYDTQKDAWEIATKSCIGGYNRYNRNEYSTSNGRSFARVPRSLRFREMMIEAFSKKRLLGNENLSDLTVFIPQLQTLSRQYCYFFTIQHECNEIVFPVQYPLACLCGIFRLGGGSEPETLPTWVSPGTPEGCELYKSIALQLEVSAALSVPLLNESLQEIVQPSTSLNSAEQYQPGVVSQFFQDHAELQPLGPCSIGYHFTHNQTGERRFVMNSMYVHMHDLKGNDNNLEYRFYRLRKSRAIHEYLHFFPQHKPLFEEFETEYQALLQILHEVYLNKFVLRQLTVYDHTWYQFCKKVFRQKKRRERIDVPAIDLYLMQQTPIREIMTLFPRNRRKRTMTKSTQ